MVYEYWLASIKPLQPKKKRMLRENLGSGRTVYYIEETKLHFQEYLNAKDVETIRKAQGDKKIEERWARLKEENIRFIPYFSREYPEKLKHIPNPPYALYVKGSLPKEDSPSAAIVGARRCTPYGEQMALAYGEKLAKAGVQVISGMARGIDGAGQRGALNGRGRYIRMRRRCLLSKRAYRAVYGSSGKWRPDIGADSGTAAAAGIFSGAEPDHQRSVRCSSYNRSKRKKRLFDYRRYGLGTGKGCLCAAWPRNKPGKPGLPPADQARRRDSPISGRSINGIGNQQYESRAKF